MKAITRFARSLRFSTYHGFVLSSRPFTPKWVGPRVRYVSRVRLRGALRTHTARRQHQQLSTRPGKSQQIIDRKANGLSRTPPCISSEQNKMCHGPLSRLGATSVCTSFRSGRSFVSQRTEAMCQNPTFPGSLGAQRGTSQDPVTAILHFGRVRGTVFEPVAANETA